MRPTLSLILIGAFNILSPDETFFASSAPSAVCFGGDAFTNSTSDSIVSVSPPLLGVGTPGGGSILNDRDIPGGGGGTPLADSASTFSINRYRSRISVSYSTRNLYGRTSTTLPVLFGPSQLNYGIRSLKLAINSLELISSCRALTLL